MNPQESHPWARLFALSFAALFLELMVIRWVPSMMPQVAYYGNLMLISSFFGLGLGVLTAPKQRDLFRWFPLFLTLLIGFVYLTRDVRLPDSTVEARFYAQTPQLVGYYLLVALFALTALPFVALGQKIGRLFSLLPPLAAYSWDLGGSLAGTLCFGAFSFTFFSPVVGFMLVMAAYTLLCTRRVVVALFFGLVVLGLLYWEQQLGIWSPYYYITYHNREKVNTTSRETPPADLHTMQDPPCYNVSVNHHFYHLHGTLDPKRYAEPSRLQFARTQSLPYFLPYELAAGRERIAVLGAGGGMDVEAALLHGARHVDAVEIDPAIIALSRRLNASGVYLDPRVNVINDDARAFLSKAEPGYDMILFGFLDSQALFSSMNNIRLDGYTYTVESFQAAFQLLNDRGMLVVTFAASKNWLGQKLFEMMAAATGHPPLCYQDETTTILCAYRGKPPADPPDTVHGLRRRQPAILDHDLATDDWPFLYLSRRTIPADYLVVILLLLALSCLVIVPLRGKSMSWSDGHFFFLGWGFLLLQTKSIGDCSLFFGTTWLVSLLVVAGILLMVLLANLTAMRWLASSSLWLYVPVFLVLGLLLAVPNEHILRLPFAGRLLWTLLIVPLPVFFAGLIFSTTFRQSPDPAAAFGANLLGAMVGGFSEYLGMVIGSRMLMGVVMAAYAGSLALRWIEKRRASA